MELRPDNVAEWDPALFDKQDPTPDFLFYAQVRKVVHIDEAAIGALTALYRELLPPGGAILDLMSSWRSHLPPDMRFSRVSGLGMNKDELADNPQLTDYLIHDLNTNPALPYKDAEFDAACCAVSVQYLQKPAVVFREVRRVLKPGGVFVVSFSNRCFPTKAVHVWLETSDTEHMQLVALYFAASGGWAQITMRDCSAPGARLFQCDPLYAVWATAQPQSADRPASSPPPSPARG